MSAAVWSTDQVLALAPDASSAKSGKDLGTPRKWVRLGQAEGVIWGECQGSGSTPYRVQVELSEPAFHCSCPSRKFPCKHGLGLLLIWAGQSSALSQGDPPTWVSEWLEGRAQRAEKKAAKDQAKQEKSERGEPAIDRVAKQKRESARRIKVVDGLDELARWLSDLVRQGLAGVSDRPPSFWDDRARRLIDAQAPGVARRVRQLADLPTTGEGWQGALLDRLARLHLMIEAHRRIDSLPPDVQADLRAAVGYPIDLDEVRAGPGFRDHWQVVGQRTEREEMLRVRRTWLVGRTTGQPALLLDFSHVRQPIAEVSIPPGAEIDADLSFFSSAFPLRALVKARHGAPSAIAEIGGFSRIADALAAHAGAIAKNPWLETFPIVLLGVVPVFRDEQWIVRDAECRALPISPRFEGGWSLLAASGGRPISIAGEYDGACFLPLSTVIDGRFRAIVGPEAEARATALPSPEGPPEIARAWQQASAVAMVGVARKPAAIELPDGPIGPALQKIQGQEPTAALLGSSALLTLYARAGQRPPTDDGPIPDPAPRDHRPECRPEAANRLRSMIGGPYVAMIEEWLDLLAESGCRLPDDLLVDLIDLGRRESVYRPMLQKVVSARGRWLSAQNPTAWGYLGGEAGRDPEEVWQTGAKKERLVALRELRASDPAKARHLIATTWSTEPADGRAAIVEALGEGLQPEDEPFLESALDDRAKTVRRAAAELLPRLTGSRLSARMAERARACVRWSDQGLIVDPPKASDAAMVRDGVEPKPPVGTGERAWWLRQIIAAAPLSTWATTDLPTPDRLIASLRSNPWGQDLWISLSRPVVRERDGDWAEALLRNLPGEEYGLPGLIRGLLQSMGPDRRDAMILESLRVEDRVFRPGSPTFHLLYMIQAPIGEELAREVLRHIREEIAADGGESKYDRFFWAYLNALGSRVPPHLASEVEGVSPSGDLGHLVQYFHQFVSTLQQRREMHQELAR